VRKFGLDIIINLVPNTDIQTHVRLRALNKEAERLKRNKVKRAKDKSNDDVDVDFSLKTKPKTYVCYYFTYFIKQFINNDVA